MPTPKTPAFVLEFTKMSGAGNDFIVIDNRFYRFTDDELSSFAKRFCTRRTGVGADGLLALCVPDDPERYAYRMKYRNADGSLGTMCGNGARCLARFALLAGVPGGDVDGRDDTVFYAFESDAGSYSATVPKTPDGPVRLIVPEPGDGREIGDISYLDQPVYTIWAGTEHAVLFVPNVDTCPVSELGPKLRNDTNISEDGTNVDFVEIVGESSLRVRTFEKGVEAETLACGTGAIASALMAGRTGRIDAREITVRMAGGVLRIGWTGRAESPNSVYLEGPADIVYRGSVDA